MDHIGIDVHKRESQISILAEGGTMLEQRIRTEPERFAAVLGARPRASCPASTPGAVRASVDPPKALLCDRRCRSGYENAQVRQPASVIADESVSIQPVEVVAAEIAVRHSIPQNVPRGDQDGWATAAIAFLSPRRRATR